MICPQDIPILENWSSAILKQHTRTLQKIEMAFPDIISHFPPKFCAL